VVGSGGEEAVAQRIDPAVNELVQTVTLGDGDPADVAVEESTVWVTLFRGPDLDHTEVVRLDSASGSVTARISLWRPRGPLELLVERHLGHLDPLGTKGDATFEIDRDVERVAGSAPPAEVSVWRGDARRMRPAEMRGYAQFMHNLLRVRRADQDHATRRPRQLDMRLRLGAAWIRLAGPSLNARSGQAGRPAHRRWLS